MRSRGSGIVVFLLLARQCLAETETCYGPGEVAGIVIAVIVVTVVLVGLVLATLWQIKKKRDLYRDTSVDSKQQNAFVEDGKFAFDNPYFRDDEPDAAAKVLQNQNEALGNGQNGKQIQPNAKNKKPRMSINPFTSVFTTHAKKQQRTMDDSCLVAVAPERILVPLRGHDFTGLGFNVCGNMRDGIFVKDVLHRGPASESGKIKAGDRIVSVTVSFSKMVYEDALTILSYASPYDVQLELEKTSEKSNGLPTSQTGRKLGGSSSFSAGTRLFHPLYRSQSIDDLTQIGKDQQAAAQQQSGTPKRSHSIGLVLQKSRKPDCIPKEGALPNMPVTGSLNERMLANAIVDEGRQKRNEQKQETSTLTMAATETPKMSTAISNPSPKEGATTQEKVSIQQAAVDGESLPRKGKRKAPAPPKPNSLETTAQIHQTEDLGQIVTKAEGSSSSSSLEKDSVDGHATPIKPFSLPDEKRLLNGNDSDVSSDSLESGNIPTKSKKKSKDRKRRSSSLGDLTVLQEAVNLKSPVVLERAVSMELSHQGALSEGNLGQNMMLNKTPTLNSSSVYSNGHMPSDNTVQNITVVTSTPLSGRGGQSASELEVSGVHVDDSLKMQPLYGSSGESNGALRRKVIKDERSLMEELNSDDGSFPDDNKEVIQISQDELDDVMMSHRQFLLKQAKVTGVYSGLSPDSTIQPTDFESWSFTDTSINGKNASKGSSSSSYNTALEAPSSDISISTKRRNPEISELTIRTPEGNITNTVIISTPDTLCERSDTIVESDSPLPRLEPPQ